jgi:cytochrome c-type biogenesis protein CcmH
MMLRGVLIFLMILGMVGYALAQDEQPIPDEPIIVTDDQVNAIANRLFCPVCENIPLDACGTAACADWRNEIRLFLSMGMTEDEIRADFVARFGDRVVGVPQDPLLRAISLVTPWLLVAFGLLVAGRLFITWRKHKAHIMANMSQTSVATSTQTQNPYLDLLEEDLKG